MNVNFYLKNNKKDKSAIFAAVRFRGKLFKAYPGVTVLTEFWDASSKRADEKKPYKDEAQIINIALERFEGKVKSFFEPHILNKTIPTQQEFKKAVTDRDKEQTATPPEQKYFVEFFKQHYENAPYKRQTWKKYNNVYKWLLKYEKHFNTRLTFNDIDLAFYENFRFWVLSKKYTPHGSTEPRNYSLNYFGSLIRCIKHVMAETGPESLLKLHTNTEVKNKRFKTETEAADTVYLTSDELLKIHHFKPDYNNIKPIITDPLAVNAEKKITDLILAKNKFLIGCYTALRVSDFNRLDEVNVKTGFITIKPKKGTRKNENVVIPIHPVIKEILDSGFDLDTHITADKINTNIKQVCQLVGINEPVTTARTEGGQVVERINPKYELITNHTARRSGATNMFLAGIPTISIMKITGHKTETSFLKYIRITQEENARLLAKHPYFLEM